MHGELLILNGVKRIVVTKFEKLLKLFKKNKK